LLNTDVELTVEATLKMSMMIDDDNDEMMTMTTTTMMIIVFTPNRLPLDMMLLDVRFDTALFKFTVTRKGVSTE